MRRNTDEDLNALRRRAEQHDLTAIEALSNAARRVGDVELAREAARLAGEVLDGVPRPKRRKKAFDYSLTDEAQRVSDATALTFSEMFDDDQKAKGWGVYSGPDPLDSLGRAVDARPHDRIGFLVFARRAALEGVIDPTLVPAAAWYYENVPDDALGRSNHPDLETLGRSRRALELAIARKTLIDDMGWQVYLPLEPGVNNDPGRARFFYGMKRGQIGVEIDLVDPTPRPGADGGTIVDTDGPYFVNEEDHDEEPQDLDELPADIRVGIALMAFKALRGRGGAAPPVATNPDEDLRKLERAAASGDVDSRLALSSMRFKTFGGDVMNEPFFFVRATDRDGLVMFEGTVAAGPVAAEIASQFRPHVDYDSLPKDDNGIPTDRRGVQRDEFLRRIAHEAMRSGFERLAEVNFKRRKLWGPMASPRRHCPGHSGVSYFYIDHGDHITIWASTPLPDGRHVVITGQPHSYDLIWSELLTGRHPEPIRESWRKKTFHRNPDDDLQALLRQVATEDDNDALIERLVREARRRGRGDLVNAAMSHANYPTWNRLAPGAYVGAAAWPEADLREGVRLTHEMLDRAAYDDSGFVITKRDDLWPVLEVLVGNRQPVRWVNEPGVHREPTNQATADVSSVVRAWLVHPIPNVAREPRGIVLVGVLDKEAGAITLAHEHTDGHGHDPLVLRWLEEVLPGRGGSWQRWARNTEAFDRVRIPVDLARQWLAEARRTWGVRPGPTDHFLDLVRYAGEASARHEFPAGWRTGDMVFDDNAQHTGYFVQEDGWERGDGARAVWGLDEQRTPAAVAWSWVLNDECVRHGFAHVTPGSEFDPDNWRRRGSPSPDRHRRQEVARRRCVHCGIEGARVLSPQGAFCDPCWQTLGGIMGGAP